MRVFLLAVMRRGVVRERELYASRTTTIAYRSRVLLELAWLGLVAWLDKFYYVSAHLIAHTPSPIHALRLRLVFVLLLVPSVSLSPCLCMVVWMSYEDSESANHRSKY